MCIYKKTKATPKLNATTINAVFVPECQAAYYEFVTAYVSRTGFVIAWPL